MIQWVGVLPGPLLDLGYWTGMSWSDRRMCFRAEKPPCCITLRKAPCRCLPVGLIVAAAVLSAAGEPTLFFGDQGGNVFEFARVGGGGGCIMPWRVVNVSVAFAFSVAAGAAGGRRAAASSSAAGFDVLLAAVLTIGRGGAFFLIRAAGRRSPSSCVSATSSLIVFIRNFCVWYAL